MPPRAPKVPFSSGGHRGFAIPRAAWGPIEVAYGRALAAEVRTKIGDATAFSVDFNMNCGRGLIRSVKSDRRPFSMAPEIFIM